MENVGIDHHLFSPSTQKKVNAELRVPSFLFGIHFERQEGQALVLEFPLGGNSVCFPYQLQILHFATWMGVLKMESILLSFHRLLEIGNKQRKLRLCQLKIKTTVPNFY